MKPRPRAAEAPRSPLGRDIEQHLSALEAAGYSSHTLRNRRSNLNHFRAWCEERGVEDAGEISLPLLERYRATLFHARQKDGRPLGWGTQAQKLVALKGLAKWLVRTHRLLYNPAAELELPRRTHHLPGAVLTAEEAERVLAQPDVRVPLGLRDRAMLEVLYSTGLRRTELIRLRLSDVDAARGSVLVREGKGGRDRLVPIGERALAWTERYLTEARPALVVPPDRGVLFLSRRGRRVRANRLSELVRDYVAAADIGKRGSCHLFRHTMATLLLEGGADIRDIQEMLGHAQLSTTQIYTRVSIQRLRQVHARAHPANRVHDREREPLI